MEKLTATFLMSLPFKLVVTTPSLNHLYAFRTNIEGYDIEIKLMSGSTLFMNSKNEYERIVAARGYKPDTFHRISDSESWLRGMSRLQISVTRLESIAPPVVEAGSDTVGNVVNVFSRAHQEFRLQDNSYFYPKLEEFAKAANEGVNRLLLFFKYKLQNGLVHEINVSDYSIGDVSWSNETGQEIGISNFPISLSDIPGVSNKPDLGVKPLVSDHDDWVTAALENRIVPELYEQLRSDAQAAAFQGNLRRAVLELAIACEVVIYQSYFGVSTPASEVFDYLVVEQYVQVPPKDLIHKVAKRAFGESFQEKHPADYNNIDNLFSCRNKVAHRGQLKYVDNKGIHEVDNHKFGEWWQSVEALIHWINEKKK